MYFTDPAVRHECLHFRGGRSISLGICYDTQSRRCGIFVQSILQNDYVGEIRHKDDETSSKRVDTESKKGKEVGCSFGNTRTSGKSSNLEARGELVEEEKSVLFCDSNVGNFPRSIEAFW